MTIFILYQDNRINYGAIITSDRGSGIIVNEQKKVFILTDIWKSAEDDLNTAKTVVLKDDFFVSWMWLDPLQNIK